MGNGLVLGLPEAAMPPEPEGPDPRVLGVQPSEEEQRQQYKARGVFDKYTAPQTIFPHPAVSERVNDQGRVIRWGGDKGADAYADWAIPNYEQEAGVKLDDEQRKPVHDAFRDAARSAQAQSIAQTVQSGQSMLSNPALEFIRTVGKVIPGAAQGIEYRENQWKRDAQERWNKGEATHDDMVVLANKQKDEQIEKNKTLGQMAGDFAMGTPKAMIEWATPGGVGGKAIGGLAGRIGFPALTHAALGTIGGAMTDTPLSEIGKNVAGTTATAAIFGVGNPFGATEAGKGFARHLLEGVTAIQADKAAQSALKGQLPDLVSGDPEKAKNGLQSLLVDTLGLGALHGVTGKIDSVAEARRLKPTTDKQRELVNTLSNMIEENRGQATDELRKWRNEWFGDKQADMLKSIREGGAPESVVKSISDLFDTANAGRNLHDVDQQARQALAGMGYEVDQAKLNRAQAQAIKEAPPEVVADLAPEPYQTPEQIAALKKLNEDLRGIGNVPLPETPAASTSAAPEVPEKPTGGNEGPEAGPPPEATENPPTGPGDRGPLPEATASWPADTGSVPRTEGDPHPPAARGANGQGARAPEKQADTAGKEPASASRKLLADKFLETKGGRGSGLANGLKRVYVEEMEKQAIGSGRYGFSVGKRLSQENKEKIAAHEELAEQEGYELTDFNHESKNESAIWAIKKKPASSVTTKEPASTAGDVLSHYSTRPSLEDFAWERKLDPKAPATERLYRETYPTDGVPGLPRGGELLNEREREVINRHRDGQSFLEIGNALGFSTTTAMNAERDGLAKYGHTPDTYYEGLRRASALAERDKQRDERGRDVSGQGLHKALGQPDAEPPKPSATPKEGKPISSFDLIETIKSLFKLPAYVGKNLVPGSLASYFTKTEAMNVGSMNAGQAPYYVHELVHHLFKTGELNIKDIDPNKLSPEEVFGFRQLDYLKGRGDIKLAMEEGFAEYLRKKLSGQLGTLSKDQQAAAKVAEKMLSGNKDLSDKLDRLQKLFDQYGQQTPVQQFAQSIGSKPGEAQLTRGERAGSYVEKLANTATNNLLNDLNSAREAEAAAKAKGEKFAPGEKLSEVMATTRLRTVPLANEFRQGGVAAWNDKGQYVKLGRPVAEILKDIPAEELGDLQTYMHARQAVAQKAKGRQYLPDDQQAQAMEALKFFAKDPTKLQRLSTAADAVSHEIFDASLKAMALSGWRTPKAVMKLIDSNPFYVSTTRILDPEWHDQAVNPLKGRTGSGEQIIGLMEAIQNRHELLARVLNKQARGKALLDLSTREGVGQWVHPGIVTADAEGKPDPIGWPTDGTRPSVTVYKDGVPVVIRINDRPFFEMYTGIQGEVGTVAPLFKSLGDFMQQTKIPQGIRVGGTLLSLPWHVKNFFRDPILAVQRTVSDAGMVSNAKDLAQWYGKSFDFYTRALKAGGADNVDAKKASDAYFQMFERLTGRELSMGATTGEKSFASRVMDGWHGLFQRIADLATAGEKGTRVWEFKNVLEKNGWTQERLAAEMKKDPENRMPIPFGEITQALDIASQITHNVHQQGVWVRQLNRSWPFLGAHIAGVYKDIQTYRDQPARALAPLAILAVAKGVEWLTNKDDKEWQEMPDYLRAGFSFKSPLGWVHLPAPRGVAGVITNAMDYAGRKAADSNPRFAKAMMESFKEIAPSGGPEPLHTALSLAANKTWTGAPIVPKSAEHAPGLENFAKYQAPFLANQATGGFLSSRTLSPNPFKMDQHPHQAVEDYYDRLHEIEDQRNSTRHQNKTFAGESEYRRMHAVEKQMQDLAREMRGDHKIGTRTVIGSPPSAERVAQIRQKQVELARKAMGR